MRPRLLLIALAAASLHAAPAWVARSDEDAQPMLAYVGRFDPEQASDWGLAQYDTQTADLAPGRERRERTALAAVRAQLGAELGRESDPNVRQDLLILQRVADLDDEDARLREKYLIPYANAGLVIFEGEFSLLNDQVPAARRAAAVERLRRYTGLAAGATPLVDQARRRFEARMDEPGLLAPYRGQIEQDASSVARYARGIRQLFAQRRLEAAPGAAEALAALDRQLEDYGRWLREVVIPRARTDFREPEPLYALQLRRIGLEIAPRELIPAAELEFSEVLGELQSLAPLVAREHGWSDTDYRSVIRRLKQDQLRPAEVEPYYRQVVIPRIEAMIREHRVATLPTVPMAMRIASDAETAMEPAPHMKPPPLVDNHGERGTFVLPLGVGATAGRQREAYDDFTFRAATWTLTAHEGRPGHELQFSRMVERGVSLTRSLFAFNSVNVEGWALYCEAEMKPYEPIDGQLIALQLRLLRAVRAFSDPMLNLGLMTPARAHELLVGDVCLSEAFAREELDRFMFHNPGQATSYFYGYTRLMQLRAQTQIALGPQFDRERFNDFIVDQGLLPPDLLAQAVQGWVRKLARKPGASG